MTTGVQFRGTVQPNQTHSWYTFNWPVSEYVVWTVVPDSINTTGSEITWTVGVQLASATSVTYWINITNQTSSAVDIEARYAILS
jgi:hypothetical protein